MPVSWFTYLYLILLTADLIYLLIAAVRQDMRAMEILVPCLFLFLIGFLAGCQVVTVRSY